VTSKHDAEAFLTEGATLTKRDLKLDDLSRKEDRKNEAVNVAHDPENPTRLAKKKGSKLIKKLENPAVMPADIHAPEGFGARPDFIPDKVEKELVLSENTSDAEQAKVLRSLKDQKEDLEMQLKAINTQIDSLSISLAESMESHGVDSFRVTGVGSVYIQELNRPNITDKDAFIVWLDETGQGALAPRSVHYKRLESLVKEMLAEGKALPASLTNFKQKRALIRRS